MRIGIYNGTGGLGGAEVRVAVLAEALSRQHEVEILMRNRSLGLEHFAEYSGRDLSGVGLRYVMNEDDCYRPDDSLPERYRKIRAWGVALSEPYDLFISSDHRLPPFCAARRGVLISLFPYGGIPEQFYQLWKEHLDSYQLATANSQFTARWMKIRWGLDCHVVYSPIDTHFDSTEKEDVILSVGRFEHTQQKKHLVMLDAYRRMKEKGFEGWEYKSAGVLPEWPKDQDYFQKVLAAGDAGGAEIMPNIDRCTLRQLYERSKIFWHAAGYGVDETERPGDTEHFGRVTVEAMAAGCVPVVHNKGGQPEIVRHATDGFLWNTVEELEEFTAVLTRDEELRIKMAASARERAQSFSTENHIARFMELLQPLLSEKKEASGFSSLRRWLFRAGQA